MYQSILLFDEAVADVGEHVFAVDHVLGVIGGGLEHVVRPQSIHHIAVVTKRRSAVGMHGHVLVAVQLLLESACRRGGDRLGNRHSSRLRLGRADGGKSNSAH